jgi:putative FmdB family regulatory protein
MPTYEYRCSNGHEFEQFQRMSEDPLRVCTVCGAPAERLLSSGAGLLFKGSGFYITDYRSDSYKKAADADSGAKPGGEARSGGDARPGGDAKSKGSDSPKAGGSAGSTAGTGE